MQEARPNIQVDMSYDDTRFAHRCKCIVGGIGEYQYVTEVFLDGGIDGNGQANQHPDWMRYHAEKMVRMAEAGVFMRWVERTLPAEHRRAFTKMYGAIKNVQLIPADGHSDQVDESWLAVLTSDAGQWRETIREIKRDPLVLYAVLTMINK